MSGRTERGASAVASSPPHCMQRGMGWSWPCLRSWRVVELCVGVAAIVVQTGATKSAELLSVGIAMDL